MRGKLIVFEGADGTGKTTQARLFFKYLQKKKIPVSLTSFPRYDKEWGKLVRNYLDGEFGNLNKVDPRLASVLYAGDRLCAKDEIEKWLAKGKVVVCDRYAASNIAHQAAKFKSQSEKSKFVKWLEDLEYKENKIPKPDLVVLLTIPGYVAQKFMAKRIKDIHEQNAEYQLEVARVFEGYARGKKNWILVPNIERNKLKPIDQVHKEIVEVLKKRGVL